MLPAGQLGQRCTWQVPSSPETRWGDRATCGGGGVSAGVWGSGDGETGRPSGGVCRCMGLRKDCRLQSVRGLQTVRFPPGDVDPPLGHISYVL